MKLLNYYISSGIVKKNEIDMSKLPSEIIRDIGKKEGNEIDNKNKDE